VAHSDPSNWIRISITTAGHSAGRVDEILHGLGALAITHVDAGDSPQFDGATPNDPCWTQQIISGLFKSGTRTSPILETLKQVLGPSCDPVIEQFPDKDWELSGRENFPPLQVSDHLWVCPPWEPSSAARGLEIIITPGLAFGTGTHPTTQLCLRALEQLNVDNQTILDFGCGSGVLAIAGLAMGGQHAIGVDLDPRALTASHENAALNDVEENLTVMTPEEIDPDSQFDIVIANILAGTIIELASKLNRHLKTGGQLILSGILASQAERVQNVFPQYNLALDQQEEWVVLHGSRN